MCSASGRELLIRIAGHGDIIGEFTLMKDGQHPTDCITQEKTQTLTIAQRALLVAANDISFYSRLTALLFHKLQSTLTTLEDLALASLEVRLARLLLRLHDSDRNRSPAQLQGLNQGQIAMMANATRPKVNQQLQRFRKAGAIDIRAGTVTVRDTNVLEGISLKST
jgi:CRP-like cAMP-binding protein